MRSIVSRKSRKMLTTVRKKGGNFIFSHLFYKFIVTARDALRLLPDPVTHRYCPLWVLYGVGPHGFLSPPSSGFEPGLVLMDKYQVRILMREAKESREGRRRRAPKADSTCE
ncbi:hypothetical protein ACOSQ4_017789 [Xanthoceras sorbifolium]